MTIPGSGPLPEVLARLSEGTGPPSQQTRATGAGRLFGIAICAIIAVLVVLASTGAVL